MKAIIKYFCASFLILMSGMMYAQNCVTVNVDFSVAVSESSNLTGNAVISFQGTSFKMSGNGIEAYCDGVSFWTLDKEAREVYIESLTPESEEYMRELSAKLMELKQNSKSSFISPEGQEVHIKVNSIKKSDGKDISSFRPSQKFDSSWVVTDLR